MLLIVAGASAVAEAVLMRAAGAASAVLEATEEEAGAPVLWPGRERHEATESDEAASLPICNAGAS